MFHLRLGMLAAGALTVLSLLSFQLVRMQLWQGGDFDRQARRHTVVAEPIPAPRGRILDCRGRLLVSNEPCFQLTVIPAELREPGRTCARLASALQMRSAWLEKKVAAAAPLEKLVLKRSLTAGEMARILSLDLPGVQVEVGSRRRYSSGCTAAHVLGTMGEISAEELRQRRHLGYAPGDPMGKSGLEKQYDRLLRGRKGVRHVSVDVMGRTLRTLDVTDPVPGADLYLTLDLQLQKVAEAALADTLKELRQRNQEDSSGAVIVLEAGTGRVRALASLPSFNPRLFARGIRPSELSALFSDPRTPLLNRGFQAAFSPGSTFKLVNSSSALQEKLCTPDSVFYCGGSYMGANCFVRSGHGSLNFEQTLALSCDVTYYRLGDQLGIDRLDRYCSAYGLGRPSGIDLPDEEGGLLPGPSWKRKALGDRWYQGDTINMSIGQGFLLVTPLQMARVTAAVANGGQVPRPFLLERAVKRNRLVYRNHPGLKKLPVGKGYLAAVRRGMRGAVVYGTGGAANLPQVDVAGKTGTVESQANRFNPQGRNHVWFVSFAPADKPRLVVVVFLEKSGGYGGSLAAPIARTIYDYSFPAPAGKR